MKHLTLFIALLLTGFYGRSQTYTRDYLDIYDTVWQNIPNASVYTPQRSLVSISLNGSPSTTLPFYDYNYLFCINHNGDTLWTKRNCLDTIMGIDTVSMLVQSVTQLQNGNYVVAGASYNSYISGYLLKQYDTLGNFVSSYFIDDTTLTEGINIKVAACGSNNLYLLYEADSFFMVGAGTSTYDSAISNCMVKKMTNTYTELWGQSYLHHYNTLGTGSGNTPGIDITNSFTTADGGIAFSVAYDSLLDSSAAGWQAKEFFRKLNPGGTTAWQINLDATYGVESGL